MSRYLTFVLLITIIQSCHKKTDSSSSVSCDMPKVYAINAAKVTVTNGVWGTIASTEGNCMPAVIPGNCKTCPVKRTVKIYEYTTRSQASPSNATIFFDSFSTNLVKEVETDDDGFFQTELPVGQYTIVIVENGKLYSNGGDGSGGLSPFTKAAGNTTVNVTMNYNANY